MLKKLSIKNFALIEDLSLDFSSKFSVITGETGSGKSILLDALSLALGKRAEGGILRDEQQKCVVEAEFYIKGYGLLDVFQSNGIEYDDFCILRREIYPSGKSRAFVNDSPTTLDVLGLIGKSLVDIHSQHQTQEIGSFQYQFYVLDSLCHNQELLEKYHQNLEQYTKEKNKLEELEDFERTSKKEYDYNTFMLKELQSIRLEEGMEQELEKKQEVGENIEQIKENLSRAYEIFSGEERGVLNLMRELRSVFSQISGYGPEYEALFERIDNGFVELDDISSEVYDLMEGIYFDPKELSKIQRKLQKIYDLESKHSVGSVAELIEIEKKLESETQRVESIEEEIDKQRQRVEQSLKEAQEVAQKISQRRKNIIPALREKLEGMLAELGIPNAQFKIELGKRDSLGQEGEDTISMLFCANKGGHFGELKKVASGGELSRIMLTVKSILASQVSLPTIIFDEIDTGVSGEISNKMGDIMKQMSLTRQVFAITHTPQVASQGNEHIKVYKQEIDAREQTLAKKLSPQERIEEIAQMLGGKDIGDTARQHAKKLLEVGAK